MRANRWRLKPRGWVMMGEPGGTPGEEWNPERDAWRSIWEALALCAGDDPERARAGHIRLCQHMQREAGQC